jgi:proline dehydrogenase
MMNQPKFDLCLRTMNLAMCRADRFCEGLTENIIKTRNKLIKKRFGNRESLEETGMRFAYKHLAEDIYDADVLVFGSLMQMSDVSDVVTKYTMKSSGQVITLTISSIMEELLKYLDHDIIIKECKKSPHYGTYYRHCIKH